FRKCADFDVFLLKIVSIDHWTGTWRDETGAVGLTREIYLQDKNHTELGQGLYERTIFGNAK
ncbi:MAG: hypothetical protein ACTH8A_18460, partial [Serratia proteamaculans]